MSETPSFDFDNYARLTGQIESMLMASTEAMEWALQLMPADSTARENLTRCVAANRTYQRERQAHAAEFLSRFRADNEKRLREIGLAEHLKNQEAT